MEDLKIYKTHNLVILPQFATKESACFDVAFQGYGKGSYKGYQQNNSQFERPITNNEICIMPGDRVMVPTGMILDIPEGYSVRLHPRSGLSLKQGLILSNSEAVIDSDYFDELFLLISNVSTVKATIKSGERLAQAEMVPQLQYGIKETMIRPIQRTNRIGGLGSTGTDNEFIYRIEPSKEDAPAPEKRGRGRPRKEA